jgi:uncharacterized membrane protein YqjE
MNMPAAQFNGMILVTAALLAAAVLMVLWYFYLGARERKLRDKLREL